MLGTTWCPSYYNISKEKKKMNDNDKIKRAGNGEGSWKEIIPNKKYKLTITIDHGDNGKVKRKCFTGKTKTECRKARDKFMADYLNGTYVEPNKTTVAIWLREWLDVYKKDKVTNKHYDSLEYIVEKQLIPAIGSIKLQKLDSKTVQKMYNEMSKSGKLRTEGGLAPKTLQHIHKVLDGAMEKTLELDYIKKKPTKGITLPKVEDREDKFFTLEEVQKLMDAVNNDDTYDLFCLTGASTGLRKGELTALTWEDIDFENKSLSVNKALTKYKSRDESSDSNYLTEIKPPKTKSSIRDVPLSSELVKSLRYHKIRLAEENLKSGRSNRDFDLVFPSENGTYLDYSNIDKHWKMLCNKAGVEYKTFHCLRHTFSTHMASKTPNPKITQTILGHSNISTTLNIYTHLSEEMKQSAAHTVEHLYDNTNQQKI